MKKMLCLLLTLALMLTGLPLTVRADTGQKLVALTFDDGPSSSLTPQLLDGLKELDAHVTFFMQGCNAENNPEVVKRAYDEGHEIANHTYNHPTLSGQGYSGTQSQVSRTNEILDKACGTGTRHLLRPPYGDYNSTVRQAAGTALIIWSVDTNDWKYRNYSHVYNHIINNASDGAIILCHDIHSTTIPAAIDAVKALQGQGYEFVSVSELFRRKGLTLDNGEVYTKASGATVYGRPSAPVITYEAAGDAVYVTMRSADGAPIYYTTDGSRLTQQSSVYTGPIAVQCPTTIQAVAAFNLNGGRSQTATLTLDKLPCRAPDITIEDGRMILTARTAGAPIYYTLNGSDPTRGGVGYGTPIHIQPGTVVRAAAGGGNYLFSPVAQKYYSTRGNVFADVMPEQWYCDAMDQLVSEGLLKGFGQDRYAPDDALTRAQLLELLLRYDGKGGYRPDHRTNTFTDVPEEAWYAGCVEWAYTNGIAEGYPEGDFRPDQPVTRQEMAKLICEFLQYQGQALPEGADCRSRFLDGNQIAQWALTYMNQVVEARLLQGDPYGKLLPAATATRGQFAAVLLRMQALEPAQPEPTEPQPEPTEPQPEQPTLTP